MPTRRRACRRWSARSRDGDRHVEVASRIALAYFVVGGLRPLSSRSKGERGLALHEETEREA